MPRERTKSTREEFNVSSYVDSCTDFKANVTCQPLSSFTAFPASATAITLLLVPEEGSRLTLAKPSVWTAELDTAVSRATEGTAYATDVAGHRVLVGLLPKKASRYNSALRPDVISNHVSTASGAKGFTSVHVVPCFAESDAHAVALVSAVARAVKRSFSAKGGKADKAYYEPATPTTVYFAGNQQSQMNTLAFSTQLCMRLVDAPTNLLDTTTYPEIAEFYAKKLGFGFKVIRGEELREKGYGGLYGVGKAAEFPPALVQLTYRPEGGIAPKDKIAFVGKGIVYDTGGLSIKTPGTGMCTMKMDMGGSAAVFTGFLALVMEKAPYAIDCILCLADNAISARAQRNDDIVIMKSGKTVEINNTDAEGRLVLGDGVNHAATETGAVPSLILDMATLTGAQGIATGKWHAGLFTNSAEWEAKVMAAGLRSGDMCFPLLYAPEFHMPEFSSKVADMRNSVKNRSNAQSSCAAAFIEENLPKDYAGAYVHLDIAFPAARDEAATGYGPAILWTLFSA